MNRLYASPLRVYLCLGILALAGIFYGLRLPVSLFPNSAKPKITVSIGYGSTTAEEFLNNYGRNFENQLRALSAENIAVEEIKSSYDEDRARLTVQFKWGVSPPTAIKEVQRVADSYASRLPEDIRDSMNVWGESENTGFLAISFFSEKRSLDELHGILEPLIVPLIAKIPDADEAELYNPTQKEVRIELKADRMAVLGLFPQDIERAVKAALTSFGGGSITQGSRQLQIQLTKTARSIDELSQVVVPTPSGRIIHLSDIARIDLGIKTGQTRAFKTNGSPSLILFATPRPGGNVKEMSEQILEAVRKLAPSFPNDIQYRVLVDPAQFIRAAVNNVFHEVLIGALLAVAILFLFIGSLRNTITAAIEIPLSMVLAFILMRLSGMNLNLISLGGLALSAGMNVDASVVVMENIFRHFDQNPGPLKAEERLKILLQAVGEVRFAVIASTLASLVVFIPLAFTSDLSYAILGDLAKTVVFSHGFSAIVALILVPTVRLHLMNQDAAEKPHHSPIESWIKKIENAYAHGLAVFIEKESGKKIAYLSLAALLGLLLSLLLPRLPKEIIGKPDTDWVILSVNAQSNTLFKQMELQAEETEAEFLKKFGNKIQYTFTQIQGPHSANIMGRLKNRSEMREIKKDLEKAFPQTPLVHYWIDSWNPAELPIPSPPQLRIALRGGTTQERKFATEQLNEALNQAEIFPRVWTTPPVNRTDSIILKTAPEQWAMLNQQGARITPADLADVARVATQGRRIGRIYPAGKATDLFLRYPDGYLQAPEDLGALPLGAGTHILPFKSLARISIEPMPPVIYREDGREIFLILGQENENSEATNKVEKIKIATEIVKRWQAENSSPVVPYFEDAEKDLNEALHQLGYAVALSVGLIFLTLVIQFGDVASAALVLVSVPLGFIGVLISLFIFKSTLSLNSVLGVILLNGISVANSIILVDFLRRLVDAGFEPKAAAIEAARKRLRPILITSLTTILGMLPIALGFGEGGRILQPLGIAVSGGLWVSMGLTLFIVPALQVTYLNWKNRRPR